MLMLKRKILVSVRNCLWMAACAMACSSCGSRQSAQAFKQGQLAPAPAAISADCEASTTPPPGATRVYIALRDGIDGSGQSVDDARDGTTDAIFDSILRCYEEGCSGPRAVPPTENLIVCLGPGTFQTLGNYDALSNIPHPTAQGFRIGKGWKVHGQGPDQTTVQLSNYLAITQSNNPQNLPMGTGTNLVLTTASDSASGVEVSDLTVDANYPALKQLASQNGSKALNLEAIRLWSARGGNWIHNVNVINAAGEIGDTAQIFETFSVVVGSVIPNSSPLDNSGNIIENVAVSAFGGGKGVGIAVFNATAEVRNNRVTGYNIGYGGWSLGPANFHDNAALDSTYGFNIDSLINNGVRIESNHIASSHGYGLVIGGFGVYENLVIRGNTVAVRDPQSIGLLFTGNVAHSVVAGNTFLVEDTGSGATAIRNIVNTKQAGLNGSNIYQSNVIDSHLGVAFDAPSLLSLNCSFGNHDEKGNPRSDMADTSAVPCVTLGNI
jgi:hypothetical protein